MKHVIIHIVMPALLWLNNTTRPDISYAVNCLGRRQANYMFADWQVVQRVLRYVSDTNDLGITYLHNDEMEDTFKIYVDASLGPNQNHFVEEKSYL